METMQTLTLLPRLFSFVSDQLKSQCHELITQNRDLFQGQGFLLCTHSLCSCQLQDSSNIDTLSNHNCKCIQANFEKGQSLWMRSIKPVLCPLRALDHLSRAHKDFKNLIQDVESKHKSAAEDSIVLVVVADLLDLQATKYAVFLLTPYRRTSV